MPVELDEYGNPIEREHLDSNDFGDLTDADRIKTNLKSGSKVYYSITHTI